MRNWILIMMSLFLFQNKSFAQDKDDAFLTLLEKGKTAFESKDYDTCTSCYESAEKYLLARPLRIKKANSLAPLLLQGVYIARTKTKPHSIY